MSNIHNFRNMPAFNQTFPSLIRKGEANSRDGYSEEKSEAVAKYSVLTDSRQLFASKYLSFLPSEEELRRELERERRLLTEDE